MGELKAVQATEPSKATKAQRELPVPEAEPASRHTIPEAGLALFRSLAAAGSNQVPSHMVHVLRRAPTQQRVQLIQQYQHSYGNAFVQRLLDGKKVGKSGAPHLAHEVEPIILPSPGQPLPPEHRMAFAQALQHPLDHVRIHTSSQVNEAAQRVQAQAFTVGHNIYFADGHYKPGTPQGDRVLGHELTHVMQHDQGRVPGVAAQERAVSLPTDQLEKEAYRQEEALVEQVPKLRRQKAGSPSFHSINSRLDYLPILRRYKPVSQPDKEMHATPSPVEGKSREPAGSFLSEQPTGVQGEVASKTSRLSEPSLLSAPRITAPPVVPPKATTATEEVPTNGTSDGAALIGTETGRPPSPTVASAGPPAPEVVKTEPAMGKAAEGTAVKAAPPSPRQAIAPAIGAVRHRAAGARKHSPSGRPVASAQAAAKNPQTEQTRDAATQTVAKLDAAKAEQVRRQQFRDKLKEAIKNATPEPKTESDAERVMKTGGRDASRELTGQLAIERKAAAGPLENANAAGSEVRASKIEPPAKTDLKQEPLGSPQSPVSAAPVVPAPLPAERLDYSSDRAPTDSAMAETGVTKTQLEKGNEPEFGKTLEARSTAEKHEATAEARYRQSEAKVQAQAHHAAEAELAEGLAAMHGVRELHIGQVVGQQVGTKTKDAIERQRITDTIAGIKNETKADVDSILISMDKEAGDIFGAGLREAERAYGETFEEEKGGVGTWLTTWGSDWEELIERSLAKARAQYLEKVNEAIDKVADCIDAKVQAAKRRVAEGHNQVKDFVRGLNVNVRQFGEEALKKVEGEFEAMESEIDQRRDGLIDKLAQQYKDSYERMSAMEEKLREENKSLWQRVYDATVGLIKKILAFKDMLLSILAKAAGVIEDIISDPIGFLGNLVSAVMSGLKNFMGKIGAYLQKGLMEWLFGALAGAGLQLPDTFDLKGIISIILQLLGLTYAYFRSRAVKLVGEPFVAALEKAADVFKVFATQGVAGLWGFIKEKVTDLKSMVMDAIFDFIKERVIIAGVTWIIGLLNPASAFFKACKAIYDIVMFFITRGSQIITLVNAIINSMAAIAKGSLGAAATWIEEALAKAIPVAIGFLAGLLGLGDITGTIRKTIEKAQEPVNKAIDWVIHQAGKVLKKAGKLLGFGKKEEEHMSTTADPEHDLKVEAGLAAIDQAERAHLKNGKMTRRDAQQVAATVKHDHPVFQSITVVDGGKTWDYEYIASPGDKKKGEQKEEVFEIIEVKAPNGSIIRCAKQGSVLVPINKIAIYPMGKVAMYPKEELQHLQNLKQTDRKRFDEDPHNEARLVKIRDVLKPNYERSQEMFESIKQVGMCDSIEDVNRIILHLLSVGEGVTVESSWEPSTLEGPLGPLNIKSAWKMLPDGTRYLATIILFPPKRS